MEGMTLIVKTVARVVVGCIVVFGIYITLTGHLTPGGGFPGGVMIALGYILVMLAFGKGLCTRKLSESVASSLDSVGALAFLAIALLGLTGGYFFRNFLPKGMPFGFISAGSIPLSNIAIGLKVAVSLFLAVLLLSIFRERVEGG